MRKPHAIKCLFVDIGGVLLTDGWIRDYREQAAKTFGLDAAELEVRHHQAFETYELGKLSLAEYLNHVVFHQERSFTPAQFRTFMFAQSKAYPEMIELVKHLKEKHQFKVVVVSNEARDLNAHRISAFKLDQFVDSFISSCFVHVRKPDPDIFRLALDVSQASADEVIYLENTPMFVEIATGLGIQSILHTDYNSTLTQLASLGFTGDEGSMREAV